MPQNASVPTSNRFSFGKSQGTNENQKVQSHTTGGGKCRLLPGPA